MKELSQILVRFGVFASGLELVGGMHKVAGRGKNGSLILLLQGTMSRHDWPREDEELIAVGLQSSESTSRMVGGLGYANTKISVIKAIEVQLQTQLTGRGDVVETHADVLFCDGYVEDSSVSLKGHKEIGERIYLRVYEY